MRIQYGRLRSTNSGWVTSLVSSTEERMVGAVLVYLHPKTPHQVGAATSPQAVRINSETIGDTHPRQGRFYLFQVNGPDRFKAQEYSHIAVKSVDPIVTGENLEAFLDGLL